MSWTDPADMDGALTGDPLPLAWWNAAMANFLFLANAPQVAVRLTVDQAVADATDHTVVWDEATWSDQGASMWDGVGAPGKVVITRAGPHEVIAHTLYASTIPVDDRQMWLYVDGAVKLGPVDGGQLVIRTNLDVGQELELVVQQSSGGSVNLEDTQTRMTVTWAGFTPPNDSA